MRQSLPRLIWRMPSRISWPMLRSAFAIEFFLDLLQHVPGNALRLIFRVQRQHPDVPLLGTQVVDDPPAFGFVMSACCSAAYSSSERYSWTRGFSSEWGKLCCSARAVLRV